MYNVKHWFQYITVTDGNTTGWGDMDIYFGCRQSTQDHIYRDDLESCRRDTVLSGVNVALSREPGQPKVNLTGGVWDT